MSGTTKKRLNLIVYIGQKPLSNEHITWLKAKYYVVWSPINPISI